MLQTAVSRIARFLACIFLAPLTAGAQPAERIMIRATSVLPDAVSAELIAVGQPVEAPLAAGASVDEVMRNHCGGSVSNAYRKAFVELNPGPAALASAAAPRRIILPACARVWRRPVTRVLATDNLADLLYRELGARPDTRLLVCQPDRPDGRPGACGTVRARDGIASQINRADGKFEDMPNPPATLQLPFSSAWTAIPLRSSIKPADATARLAAAAAATEAGADLLTIAKDPGLDLVGQVSTDDLSLAPSNCALGGAPLQDWPFNRDAVRQAIHVSAAFAKTRRGGLVRSVIRVADTGVARLEKDPGFALPFLAVNMAARNGDRTTDRRTGFAGAYYGINADNGGIVEPLQTQSNSRHGTQVADLALGGTALRLTYPKLAELIGLNVARLFTESQGAGVWVNPATLISALKFRPPEAHIINFSVGGPNAMPPFGEALGKLVESRQLAVIAAGNDGESLADLPLYPAAYAAESRVALLVVGAHGPGRDGAPPRLAKVSNYGPDYVDLLAPGCLLPAPFGDGDMIAGTSFAAPLVSFTAGVIRALLYEPQSIELRFRLWASVRWVSKEIEEATLFGGVLDVPAAVRVFDDLVRLRGGELVPGRWLVSRPFEPCGGSNGFNPDRILRVRVELGGGPRLFVLRKDANNIVREEVGCQAATEDGPILLLEDGTKRTFRWADMETLIPAADAKDRRIPPIGVDTGSLTGSGLVFGGANSFSRFGPPSFGFENSFNQNRLSGAASTTSVPGKDEAVTRSLDNLRGVDSRSLAVVAPSASVPLIQKALVARGADLSIDGRAGPGTVSAIKDFQRARTEAPTGVLTRAQQDVLLTVLLEPHQ